MSNYDNIFTNDALRKMKALGLSEALFWMFIIPGRARKATSEDLML